MYNHILSTYWEVESLRKVIMIGNAFYNDKYYEFISQYYKISTQEKALKPKVLTEERKLEWAFYGTSIFHLSPTLVSLPKASLAPRRSNRLISSEKNG
ncbi:hypothetical protein Ddc_18103 [Ditylenchus destructor]|nr:hypothetical protein Ddc_18103 [Ditylenchus destructor]